MMDIPLRIYAMFTASVLFQILAVTLLLRTRGFTAPLPTLACCVLFVCGIWMIARMYQSAVRSSES